MARAALPGRLSWLPARIAAVRRETARARTLVLDVERCPGHRAGQHVDVRLTAADGYEAQRSYSIASAPGTPLEITVERLSDGELSSWLVDEARPGDVLDLRGPIGGYFVWDSASGGPLLLVAGGSGVVPLMSIERNRRLAAPAIASTLLLSARAPEDVLYAAELDGATLTYTRRAPAGWTGYDRRIDAAMLTQVAPPPEARPRCFVCGPTAFVERVSQDLLDLGHDSARVKTERFGATG
ncbi:MAG: ferredoxin reductase [Solirubrobacterales bacterium]|nr:ferredoxin reductase [Solirubrobacterales bacterium]